MRLMWFSRIQFKFKRMSLFHRFVLGFEFLLFRIFIFKGMIIFSFIGFKFKTIAPRSLVTVGQMCMFLNLSVCWMNTLIWVKSFKRIYATNVGIVLAYVKVFEG